MSENDDLLPDFLAEANDILDKTNLTLDAILDVPNKAEVLDSVYRGVHTIKGGCAMFNYVRTKDVAHALESHLSTLKNDAEKITAEEVSYIRTELQKVEELLKNKDKPKTEVPPKQESAPAIAVSPEAPPADDYIRVTASRINSAMNGISEIFLIRNQMVYLVERLRSGSQDQRDFLQTYDLLDNAMRRAIGELERSTMSMRMMNVQALFSRMARVVQSYNTDGKKKIHFKTQGESTELDKKVLDTLGEPLIHLVRNAMDHGIESCADRIANGKPETGTIVLSASLQGNEAIIQIQDDGKGIDPQKILASAKAKGLDTSKAIDDRSTVELIFMPGFSTAETISEVSGRGVGMDAVRNSVTSLGGRVNIDTEVGKGSTFTIRLPVSMSLLPVVLIDVNGFKYAVPNQDILETVQTNISKFKTNGNQEYVMFRDNFIPCHDLRKTIESKSSNHDEDIRKCSVIIFRSDAGITAARVSAFERNTEIIVKPLSRSAQQIPWVTGVSVLPTGEPVFVLSLHAMQGAANAAA